MAVAFSKVIDKQKPIDLKYQFWSDLIWLMSKPTVTGL
jgi:hypothetical protein